MFPYIMLALCPDVAFPSSASCVQSDRGLFVVDLDEPNSVDEGRVQEGVCSECLCTSVGGSSWLAIWCAM